MFRKLFPKRSSLSVAGLERQRYDPDIVALDRGSSMVTRERFRRGFGAPPIVAYAQGLGEWGLGIRERILAWLPAEPIFPKLREFLQPPETP